jgi:hypothetical protein
MSEIKFIDPIEAILCQIQDNSAPNGWGIIHQLHSYPSSEEIASRNAARTRLRQPLVRPSPGLALQLNSDQVSVTYDYRNERGAIEQSQATFFDVLALQYRRALPSDGDNAGGMREIRCQSASEWLSEVIVACLRSGQRENGGVKQHRTYHHYTVFSTTGHVDVVSAASRVQRLSVLDRHVHPALMWPSNPLSS